MLDETSSRQLELHSATRPARLGSRTGESKATGGDFLDKIVAAQRRQASGAATRRSRSRALEVNNHRALAQTQSMPPLEGTTEIRPPLHPSSDGISGGMNNIPGADRSSLNREKVIDDHFNGDRADSTFTSGVLQRKQSAVPVNTRDLRRYHSQPIPDDKGIRHAETSDDRIYKNSEEEDFAREPMDKGRARHGLVVAEQLRRESSQRPASREDDLPSDRWHAAASSTPSASVGRSSSTVRTTQPSSASVQARASIWNRDLASGLTSRSGQEGPYQGAGPMRKLFNPSLHDPLKFQKTNSAPSTGTGSNTTASSALLSSSVRTLATNRDSSRGLKQVVTNAVPTVAEHEHEPDDAQFVRRRTVARTHGEGRPVTTKMYDPVREDESAGDRIRERLKRREGSDRGSLTASQRKRSETKSRSSRSSEGSESLKDRDRGRGKSDTGIMPRLREAYKAIQALEQSLSDLHRRMSTDPSGGLRVLIHFKGTNPRFAEPSTLVFEPNLGTGAAGILRQAEDAQEFSRHESKSSPTVAAYDSDQRPLSTAEENEAWVDLVLRHKRLADAHHDFLILCLDPLIPASLHNLPVKYNIPTRLWQTAFHLLLERMRHTWVVNSPAVRETPYSVNRLTNTTFPPSEDPVKSLVLDHLTDFIYDAYSFYTNLLEETSLTNFKTAWLEALGDLARYRMAVAAHVTALGKPSVATKHTPTINAVLGRIDDDIPSSGASIGAEVAENWDVEERETWRITARDWYVLGLVDKPGEGRLHHHLGLLCRDVRGEEIRALYHFTKSLTASHPYTTSKESILPLFDMSIQKRRSIPEAGTADLFLLLHGMIFTRIQLDDFDQVFDRLRERLEEDAHASRLHVFPQHDSISQSTWLTMAVINISAIMQYGSEEGYLRKTLAEESTHRKTSRAVTAADIAAPVNPPIGLTSVAGKMRAQEASEATTPGDSTFTASRIIPSANESASLENAARVTFLLLRHCFRYPVHSASAVNVLNPYITSMLTFLGTILRHAAVLAVFERFIPWLDMVQFMNSAPLQLGRQQEAEYKLIIGPPLPEDWCIRGMEWVGRRVFERGFWKARASHPKASNPLKELSEDIDGSQTSRIQNEMDVLLYTSENGLDHGGDNYESPMGVTEHIDAASSVTRRRWKRVLWSMSVITNCVDGLEMDGTSKQPVKIVKNGALDRNLQKWEQERNDSMMQERNRQRQEEEARGEWSEDRDGSIGSDEEIEAETDHDPILANLGNRRRELLSVLAQTRQDIASAKTSKRVCSSLSPMELPGYTVLVFDTNVLLDALGPFARLYESGIWTLIIPLPVVTELDGLAKQFSATGQAATAAIRYLENNIRASTRNLKVQTSKGNYLTQLFIRSEIMDSPLNEIQDREATMDDFILRVASFQADHFVDRSNLLGQASDTEFTLQKHKASKVLFFTFDRNLRLRAKARGIQTATEKDLIRIAGEELRSEADTGYDQPNAILV